MHLFGGDSSRVDGRRTDHEDRAHDRKSDLQRTLEAALQPVQDLHPRRLRSELDEMWEAADAAHAHLPTETESVPLLNAPPLRRGR